MQHYDFSEYNAAVYSASRGIIKARVPLPKNYTEMRIEWIIISDSPAGLMSETPEEYNATFRYSAFNGAADRMLEV